MTHKRIWITFFVLLHVLGFTYDDLARDYFLEPTPLQAPSYPDFQDNPYLDERMRRLMAPHLLPIDHPIKKKLDAIFQNMRATENTQSLMDAGFTIIASVTGSYVTVARHPAIPGYVFKLYLDSEMRNKDGIANCEWLTTRCIGAAKIRKVIKQKKIRFFTIPDKWLYVLPLTPASSSPKPEPVLLVATDMELESTEMTEFAWKHYIKPKHLDELYAILKHGYGTIGLVRNIPYTKKGVFAFTDTEYPERNLNLEKVKPYLSKDMQRYWDTLTE